MLKGEACSNTQPRTPRPRGRPGAPAAQIVAACTAGLRRTDGSVGLMKQLFGTDSKAGNTCRILLSPSHFTL